MVEASEVSEGFFLNLISKSLQMEDDLFGAFGDLEVDVDTSVADARSARIQAARDLAKQYSAKIEEDGVSLPLLRWTDVVLTYTSEVVVQ